MPAEHVLQGDSPLTIPPSLAGVAAAGFLVRAPGHANALVALDFEAGGAREVLLRSACELRLYVDVPPDEPLLELELRRVDATRATLEQQVELTGNYAQILGRSLSPYGRSRISARDVLSQPWTDAPGQLDAWAAAAVCTPPYWTRGVPHADWQVFDRLDPGDWIAVVAPHDDPRVARGAAVVRLEPGRFVERRIKVHPPLEMPIDAIPVSGVIGLGPGWESDESTRRPTKLDLVRAVGADSLASKLNQLSLEQFTDEGGGRFRFVAGALATGTWYARLPQYGFSRSFELFGTDPIEIAIDVGAPCDIELVIRERSTAELADIRKLTYWTGDGDAGSEPRAAERDESLGAFRFVAPLGTLHVHLDLFDEHYFVTERAFALAPGRNDLVFEVEKRATLRPLLTDGNAIVPWSDLFHLYARRIGGSGGLTGWIQRGGRDFQYVLSPAGRYVIRVDAVPGFEPSDPIEVELPAGKVVDLTIPLKRER
jgi:hypothetical protein